TQQARIGICDLFAEPPEPLLETRGDACAQASLKYVTRRAVEGATPDENEWSGGFRMGGGIGECEHRPPGGTDESRPAIRRGKRGNQCPHVLDMPRYGQGQAAA